MKRIILFILLLTQSLGLAKNTSNLIQELTELRKNNKLLSSSLTAKNIGLDLYQRHPRTILAVTSRIKEKQMIDHKIINLEKGQSIADVVPFSCSYKNKKKGFILAIIDNKKIKESVPFGALEAFSVDPFNGKLHKISDVSQINCNWTPGGDERFPSYFPAQ